MPAAAELPAFLLERPEGVSPLPDLKWFPAGADEELQVIPAASLPVIMGTNLGRAPTGFDAVAGDHYRIGLVVSDEDYRPGLLQLPEVEQELVELLYRNARWCENATMASRNLLHSLAGGFEAPANPEIASVPELPQKPPSAQAVLENLGDQDWQAKSADTQGLHAPYQSSWPAPPDDLPAEDAEQPVAKGLLAKYVEETETIDALSEMLEDIDDLLEMLESERKQQRGLVDTLTIDLARLAGGIAGDGSGIKLASAAREINFIKKE